MAGVLRFIWVAMDSRTSVGAQSPRRIDRAHLVNGRLVIAMQSPRVSDQCYQHTANLRV